MWRRAAAKILSLRSVAKPNHGVTSSRLPSSDVFPLPIATGHERVEPEPEPAVMKSVAGPKPVVATPLWTSPLSFSSGPASKERQEKTGYDIKELVGGDIVDYDFVNCERFGTEEKPLVMRSLYNAQVAGCSGPYEDKHDSLFFWLQTGVISVCPICSQHFTLKCVGRGGIAPRYV